MSNLKLPVSSPRLPPALQAGLIHLLAWALVLGLASGAQQIELDLNWRGLTLMQGLLAGSVSYFFALPAWWLVINLLFFPLLAQAQQWELAPHWYLAGLAALLLTQLGAVRNRVPLYLSSHRAKSELLRLLPTSPGLRFLDIGSGTGGLLAFLAKNRPELVLNGIESAPALWLLSRLRLGTRASIALGDLWHVDLSRYDVVYAFLSPEPMTRLWQKAKREMPPGSLFVSNTFEVPGVKPDASIELHDLHRGRLLLWRMA